MASRTLTPDRSGTSFVARSVSASVTGRISTGASRTSGAHSVKRPPFELARRPRKTSRCRPSDPSGWWQLLIRTSDPLVSPARRRVLAARPQLVPRDLRHLLVVLAQAIELLVLELLEIEQRIVRALDGSNQLVELDLHRF